MDYATVMYPMVNGEKLESIYINMDSTVLMKFRAKRGNLNQQVLETANRKYISTVYSHTLLLYSITKARKYQLVQEENGIGSGVELGTYLKDLFESHYAEFILNFGTEEFMPLLED